MDKKVLFFIGSMGHGGAQRVISILSRIMVDEGFDVEILSYYDAEPAYNIDQRVKYTVAVREAGSKNTLKVMLWLRKYFLKNASIILSFLAPFNMVAIVANAGQSIPLIVADRNDPARVPVQPIIRKLRNLLYRFADAVVVQTQANRKYFHKIEESVSVIYNPVSVNEKTNAWQSSEHKHIIVSVGRLVNQKRHENTIDAFEMILEKHPEYELHIYGEGPEKKNLETYVAKKSLQSKVVLQGNVSDIHDRMLQCELFVMASEYEGMPNALIEAMCLGMPVISTKVSGATDFICHGVNGLLVNLNDVDELANAIEQMVCDSEQAASMGHEASLIKVMLEERMVYECWKRLIDQWL